MSNVILSEFEILSLINVFLGFVMTLFCIRFMKYYKALNDFWRRLLILGFFYIFHEITVFSGMGLLEGISKTVFLAYFIYLLTFLFEITRGIMRARTILEEVQSQLASGNVRKSELEEAVAKEIKWLKRLERRNIESLDE